MRLGSDLVASGRLTQRVRASWIVPLLMLGCCSASIAAFATWNGLQPVGLSTSDAGRILADPNSQPNRCGLAETQLFRIAEQAMILLEQAAERSDEVGAAARAHLERLRTR